uniref:Retrovirus-related Pol polyprotein from transposon TNT 1-94 n=1 Tax=Cajanus cajan TaxID=3821 RepID=A0A151TPS7_CAJCA|nr:Retrovirus-related Pol polyprotein from transposon TNT 1-94 [Cajanus cajan]KYP69059.1 Retrovirus-related Pol polyprotein from transposon TNT 1-94 [Cajanus cajan]KYP69062.1 Retrovirus-related Pol polyprotein from transposon TNT 1-94 [Cajanus cajan]
MKNLGAANRILGMEIYRGRSQKKLFLCQKDYIQKILHRFGMHNAKPLSTPMLVKEKLKNVAQSICQTEQNNALQVPYASVVGSLMYTMV